MLYCMTCGADVLKPKTYTRGSFVVEVALWLCFLVPGLLYSVWRLTSRTRGCPNCQATSLVPGDSVAAQVRKAEVRRALANRD